MLRLREVKSPTGKRATGRPRDPRARGIKPTRPREDLAPQVEGLISQLEHEELLVAQRELEMSREHFADLYDFAPVGYLTLNRNGIIGAVNVTASQLLGSDRVHLVSHPLLPRIAGPDRRSFLSHLSRLRRGERQVTTELRIEVTDHEPIPVQLISIAGVSTDAAHTSFRTAIVDISGRKRAEEALARHLDLLASLLKDSMAVMAESDMAGVLQRAADAARELTLASFGTSAYSWVNGSFGAEAMSAATERIASRAAEEFRSLKGSVYQDLFQAAASIRLGRQQIRDRAAWRTFPAGAPLGSLLAVRLLGSDGRPIGVIMVGGREAGDFSDDDRTLLEQLAAITSLAIQHIEARTQAEESARETRELNATLEQRVMQRTAQIRALALELTRAEERERKQVAQILHDHLQQLLAGARMLIDRVQSQARGVKQKELIGRVVELIDEGLSECKSLAVELSPPILHEAGLTAALMWLGRWMEQHHGLRVKIEAGVQLEQGGNGVAALLFQSTRELLFNVVKHAGVHEAEVTLGRSGDGQLSVVVEDKGAGFNPGEVRHDNGETAFGLFSIRERVRLLGGETSITSAPGEGTRVTLRVPMPKPQAHVPAARLPEEKRPAAAPTTAEPRRSVRRTRRIRVLLVDDHKIMREGLANLLSQECDIEVVGEAENGQIAVDMTRRLQPDVVVMDITMPVMNGIEATQVITRDHPGVRVIGLSIYDEADRAEAMRAAGASAYVCKSEASTRLLGAIRSCAKARRKRTISPVVSELGHP